MLNHFLIHAIKFSIYYRKKYKDWILDEQKAKTIARAVGSKQDLYRRRRWTVKAIWGEEEDEEESEMKYVNS